MPGDTVIVTTREGYYWHVAKARDAAKCPTTHKMAHDEDTQLSLLTGPERLLHYFRE